MLVNTHPQFYFEIFKNTRDNIVNYVISCESFAGFVNKLIATLSTSVTT